MKYFIGIDNSSLDHKVRIIDEKGNLKKSFTIENSLIGFNDLYQKIKPYLNTKIGFELPHGPLVDYLHNKNFNLYSLNPLKIKRYKETLKVSGNKNDDIDALAIAEYLRNNVSNARELIYNSSEIERLKSLSIIHTRITQNHARHLNKLHFTVRQYFPLHESLFSDFGGNIQLKLLKKYPLWGNLRAASNEELTNFLMINGYRRKIYIEKIIAKIRSYNQIISPDVEFAYQFEANYLCDILLVINSELNEIEKEMNSITDSHRLGIIFKSLPGAGRILACKLLACFGDNKSRFDNSNGVQCLFGTAPKNYQSGNYHKVIMRQACNKSARAILFKFAFASLNFSKWARKYYDYQKVRGKTHSVATRALSNKWVKTIFSMWKNEEMYQENKKIFTVA